MSEIQLLRALTIDGCTLKRVDKTSSFWIEAATLRRETHYHDCWSHLGDLLTEDEYHSALADLEIDPSILGPMRAGEEGTDIFSWFRDGHMIAWISLVSLELMPTSVKCLTVVKLYIKDEPNKSLANGLISALYSYAKLLDLRLIHFNLLPHNQLILEQLVVSGADVRNVEVDWVL